MRHLSDEDLEILGIFLEERILTELRQAKDAIMATLAQLVTDDSDLATEVGTLIAAYEAVIAAQAGGTLTTDQQAQVDAADATLQTTKASVVAALAPPVVTPPAAFVMKIDGEDYPTFQARVTAWNADPANVDNPATDPGPDAWAALPIG